MLLQVASLPDRECPGLKPAETEICVVRPSCGLQGRPMADMGAGAGGNTMVHTLLPVLSPSIYIVLAVLHTVQVVGGPETLALAVEEGGAGEEGADGGYSWKIAGFTTCTASCLGGLQESIVVCVETDKVAVILRVHRMFDNDAVQETPVAPYYCDPAARLEIEVRTCNENPCPPRWNVSDFDTCSKDCGGGTQTRGVQCIQVCNPQ